jgi:hypothetical protein
MITKIESGRGTAHSQPASTLAKYPAIVASPITYRSPVRFFVLACCKYLASYTKSSSMHASKPVIRRKTGSFVRKAVALL